MNRLLTKAKPFLVATIFMAFYIFAEGQTTDTLRMTTVIDAAIKNNDRMAAARYMELSAQKKIGPAGAWDDPMLMLGIINLPTSFIFNEDMMTMKMIGISQNIPYAGQKSSLSRAAKAEAQAAMEDRRLAELDLTAAAIVAYSELYYRQRILAALYIQKNMSEQVTASVSAKLQVNQANQADFEAAQADQWRFESEILSAQQEVDVAALNLNALMGKEPDSMIPMLAEPSFMNLPENANTLIEMAQADYPPLQKLQRQAQSYAYQATASRRMRWPMLGLSADYGFRENMPMEKQKDMVSFQMSISVPIFSGHQEGNMAASMEAMRLSTEAEAHQLSRDIKANLRALHQRALRLFQSKALYQDKIIPADENAFRSSLAGFTANKIPFANLLSYASSIYKDRVIFYQTSFELARVMAEITRYTATNQLKVMSE
jgi:cobalt-zinc-cadmium efflux system outer membrane protein